MGINYRQVLSALKTPCLWTFLMSHMPTSISVPRFDFLATICFTVIFYDVILSLNYAEIQ